MLRASVPGIRRAAKPCLRWNRSHSAWSTASANIRSPGPARLLRIAPIGLHRL